MLRRAVIATCEYFALYVGLGFLAFLCIFWSLFAVILHRLLPERWGRPLGRNIIMAGFRLYIASLSLMGACRFDLRALDILRDQGSLIIAPNHPSLLDAVMVISRLPDVACILKAKLMDSILFGAGARLARYIRNDSPHGMVTQAVEDLRRGSHLLLFPEGTRTTRPPVNPFKGSLGLIANHARVPIQTVFIETDSAFLGKTWPLFRRPSLPITYRLRLGRRFDPPDNVRNFMAELERYFASELRPLSTETSPLPASPSNHDPSAFHLPASMTTMNTPSATHLVLIPTYNPGWKVYETVAAARRYWNPVWVVVDGSTDGTAEGLLAMARDDPCLRVIVLPHNQGKGAAVLHGVDLAAQQGYTHVLTMDSDGQHPADLIPAFMATSAQQPGCMVLGVPVFDASVPSLRVKGRKVSNWWANLETLWAGVGDSLFGFRVYPVEPLRRVMRSQRWMRRFDFDPEAVVRMCWHGVKPVNLPAPVRYFRPEEGGVSHFNYWRDNALLTWMHTRLFLGSVLRLPLLLARRLIDDR